LERNTVRFLGGIGHVPAECLRGVSEDSVKVEVEVEDGVAGSEEAVLVRLFWTRR